MSGLSSTSTPTGVPAPGQAALPAPDAAALLRRNAVEFADRPAIAFGEHRWTHAEYFAESCRWADLFRQRRRDRVAVDDPDAHPDGRPPELADADTDADLVPFHVAVLLENTPDYLFALGGAALAGATVVGLNHTRHGQALRRDLTHTHCGLVVTESRRAVQLAEALGDDRCGLTDDAVVVSRRFDDGHPDEAPGIAAAVGEDLEDALAATSAADAGLEPGPDTRWALIFTSGTSSAPKAVICTQRRLMGSGARLGMILGVTPDDVGYVCMPLFHSNALMVGWAPSVVYGASVGLRRRFSASSFLGDVRAYGATWFNYTGKPLSYVLGTAEDPHDADNSLRIAYGNEGSPRVVEEFSRRFGVRVIDAFGATEGGVAVDRDAPPRPGALGKAGPTVAVVGADGTPLPRAHFDAEGRLTNAEECVGEIVNTAGAGPFEGYYNNDEATQRTTRNGWFWSGDLGYLDADGYLFFAGRNADWIRVDGENFPAGPIADALSTHPDVAIATVYGVPDVNAGDQVMTTLVLRDGAAFDPAAFAAWVDECEALSPKWRPRYVRIATGDLPTTGTNKIVTRTLVHHKFRSDRCGGDPVFVRQRDAATFTPFTSDVEAALHDDFRTAGRLQFWDL